MNNIKYSIKEFKHSIFFKLLIVVQITIAIILLYKVIEIKNYENGKLNLIEEITKNKTIYTFSLKYNSFQDIISDKENTDKFSNLSDSIQKRYDLVTTTCPMTKFQNFDNIDQFIDKGINESAKQGGDLGDYSIMKSLECTSNFFDIFDLKLCEGDFDEFNNYTEKEVTELENQVIPIILGDSYKIFFNLNDKIVGKDRTYKVVGFLEKDQFFLDKGLYEPTRAKDLNTSAIVPSPKDVAYKNLNNSFLVIKNDNSTTFEEVKSYVDNLANDYDVKLSLYNPDQNIKTFTESVNYNVNIKIIIIYLVIAFVTIGLIVIFSNRISIRRKEFSLHIMHGARFKDIYIRIFLEHIYPTILAILLAFIYLKDSKEQVVSDTITFNALAFAESSLILLLILLIIAIIPICNIKRHKLNYLIRGE